MKFLRKKSVWVSIIIIAVIATIVVVQKTKPEVSPQYIKVATQDLRQKVSVTGTVKPIDSLHLTFEQNGKINDVNVKVGDKVKAGDILVTLTSQELWAQRKQAQADLDLANAQLREAERGTRSEEMNVQYQQVYSAQGSVSDAENALTIALKSAFTQADYAIRSKIDQFFSNTRLRSGGAKLTVRTKYSLKENKINTERFYIEKMFETWEKNTDNLGNIENLSRRTQESKVNLLRLQSFLKDIAYIFHDITPTSSVPQTTIDGWIESINTARTNINSALSSVTTAQDVWNKSKQGLSLQEETLYLKDSGSTNEQIAIAQARVKSAEAQVQYIQAQIAKTVISAPIDGVITKQEAKQGEIISLSSMKEILISMIGEGYEIELNVPEIDISKIKIGDLVLLEFDAFDNYTFESEVTFIEPGETVVQGVVYYQVNIELDPKTIQLEIRSGMSVDVDIVTEQKENVIAIPQRYVSGTNGDKHVTILKEDGKSFSTENVSVKVGIRGENGLIEITEGLKEGMKVVKPE